MNYRLGLDIGISSVGFSVLQTDENGEPEKIKDLGVRIFDTAEQPKTGASLAEPRRLARGTRRVIRRRAHRRDRVMQMLKETFGADIAERIAENRDDIFYLRYAGIEKVLTPAQFGRVLLYFVKHRGFLSNRKAESKEKEGGKLLSATKANSEYLNGKGYLTVGEMLYKDEKYSHTENGVKVYTVRNKENEYDNTFKREDLKKELEKILSVQQAGGLIDGEFAEKYLDIFYKNRNYDEGPAKPSQYRGGYAIGKCPFEPEENRAPKASYTFEYCAALAKLNNLKIVKGVDKRELSKDERETVLRAIKAKSEIKYDYLRKALALSDEETFSLLNYSTKKDAGNTKREETEKARFVSMKNSYEIRKALTEEHKQDVSLLDKIALILSTVKSDDRRIAEFTKINGLTETEIDELLNLNAAKFGGTSIKFLNNIKPYLEKGEIYSTACQSAGYDHAKHNAGAERSRLLNTEEVRKAVDEIAVPVVKRAVSQTIKVINAVINAYGSPIAVNVELARELSKTFKERNKIKKENEERAADNERLKGLLEKEHHIHLPSGQDILKYRLYQEQGGKCAYSGKEFDINRLFEPNYAQIDHIIPYSKSFDDSFSNKVLVFTAENQNKKDRLPYEYFGGDEKRWNDFQAFVLSTYKNNRAKAERLLKKKFTEEDAKAWKERNLNDTKYITKFVYNLINDYLLFDPAGKFKKKTVAVNGRITAYMRKMWGLNKVREEGDKHHAMDAAVVACVSDGTIRKITEYNKGKERFLRVNGNVITADGEVMTEERYDVEYGIKMKQPYEGFSKELEYRLANNPKYYTDFFVKTGYSEEELDKLRPVFVSRMVNRKAKGQIHDATVRSAKIYKEKGEVITKTPLEKLVLKQDDKADEKYYLPDCGDYYIENYHNPQDDRLLYERLLKTLIKAKKEGVSVADAFKGGVNKPKSDGTDGAPVKKVKIKSKATSGVLLEKVNGFADNGGMVRADVFTKDGKYYVVPVYIKDVYAKVLPNKAIVAKKPYEQWIEMDGSFEFLFSLYKNDLIYFEHKKGINLTKTNSKNKDDRIMRVKGHLYYNSINISTGGAEFFTHDNSYEIGGLGVLTLKKLQKCSVDVLGNITFVKKEKRQGF
ncbi:MAG: type II CRISPR RNA-guided endonuclease Cas9 [Clostridia bacterium]|nr:type II CRISPR RNA-guided endonuclease Cas9 [Clostridia bacterium]